MSREKRKKGGEKGREPNRKTGGAATCADGLRQKRNYVALPEKNTVEKRENIRYNDNMLFIKKT